MPKHEQFRQLCALAALGEVPPAEARELNRHLASCPDCRQAYSDYLGLNASLVPLTDHDTDALIEACRETVKTSVFQSIAAVAPEPAPAAAELRPIGNSFGTLLGGSDLVWLGTMVAACALCVFWLGTHYEQRFPVHQSIGGPHLEFVPTPAPNLSDQAQIRALEARASELSDALRFEKQRNAALEQTVATNARQHLLTEQEKAAFEQRLVAQGQELAGTQSQLAAKIEELRQKEAAKSSDVATLVALRYQVQDLTEKLNAQSESLKRERDLLASGREIRDIIGARNLHIVDVYDTDVKGHTKKPFARAFYTEGKSLVFYAYDLPAHPEVGAYVAWGQRNGSKSTIRNLGTLVNDDQGQKRWMFRFNDPNVLAEIDSVFITLEPAGRDATQPSSKRMLTAYLNDLSNHP